MSDPDDPRWRTAFVAHKDGYWCGVSSSSLPDIGKWLGRWAREGFTITTVHTRAEYNALLDTLKPWDERPKAPQTELF